MGDFPTSPANIFEGRTNKQNNPFSNSIRFLFWNARNMGLPLITQRGAPNHASPKRRALMGRSLFDRVPQAVFAPPRDSPPSPFLEWMILGHELYTRPANLK
ncbi:hypothetical protein NPIL_444371 [Nephila pilipes]|uniref:Uncharacterized protein n=1 Tax=Nephila pilipes TaxID=299642 RepID=A0A8X6MPB2_NEPPI|nr:hypothetical protein NPIL_444371 [Nephila pilipes]